MSIIGGAIIAAAPAVIFAFFKIFESKTAARLAWEPSELPTRTFPRVAHQPLPLHHEDRTSIHGFQCGLGFVRPHLGIGGNLFWWLVGGVGAGLILFFLLLVAFRAGLMTSFGVAVVPILLCLAYIFGLGRGKPPGFDPRLPGILARRGWVSIPRNAREAHWFTRYRRRFHGSADTSGTGAPDAPDQLEHGGAGVAPEPPPAWAGSDRPRPPGNTP